MESVPGNLFLPTPRAIQFEAVRQPLISLCDGYPGRVSRETSKSSSSCRCRGEDCDGGRDMKGVGEERRDCDF